MTKRKWLRVALIAGVLLVGASVGFSRALRAGAVRRYLVAHLAASFGRPVEVSWFDFSLLDGARIEAHLVTVAEDPHFGQEYFLRAETLTAGLRWRALLGGRFEFGSLSLLRPSLNLTRDTEGRWNIERWLPPAPPAGVGDSRPGFAGPSALPREVRPARLYRIRVDGGRINFKQQENKSPFALVDVSGSVEQNAAGRWQLDLEARPMRAGVELQDIGAFRLRGSIAGTTARLQPAELNLSWRSASLADTLRLVRQNDYGMRGALAVDLTARVAPREASALRAADSGGAQWAISGVARLAGIHGWRLPERSSDPSANLIVEASWRLGEPRAEIRKLLLELPGSRLEGRGELDWARGFHPQLRIEPSTLAFEDVVSWRRALQPGVAEDLRAEGALRMDLTLGGWPLQLRQGAVASPGGTLSSKSLPTPFQVGPINASVSRGGLEIAQAEFSFAGASLDAQRLEVPVSRGPKNSLVLRGSVLPRKDGVLSWPPDWNLSVEGTTSRVQDWLAVSAALAQPVNSGLPAAAGWRAAGGIAFKMRGTRREDSAAPVWVGTMDFFGLTLSPPYVNQPLLLPKARVEFSAQQRTVTLSLAEAFGAVWRGSMARKSSDTQWTFDLSADRLDAGELDRWLGPRARPPGLLSRFTGLGAAALSAPLPDAAVAGLAAHGRLRLGEIDLAPMHAEQFDGQVEIAGRTVRVRKAQANFFQGVVSGMIDAQLLPDPSYAFQAQFDSVNLAGLARAVPSLNGRIAGTASSSLALTAHGVGRENLLSSLVGLGALKARNLELRGLDLSAVFPGDVPDPVSGFSSVQGAYRIQKRTIDLADFVLDHAKGKLQAEGRIDFSHTLNIQVHPSIFQAATAPASVSPPNFVLSGTIEAPQLVLPLAVPGLPTRSAARQR